MTSLKGHIQGQGHLKLRTCSTPIQTYLGSLCPQFVDTVT